LQQAAGSGQQVAGRGKGVSGLLRKAAGEVIVIIKDPP